MIEAFNRMTFNLLEATVALYASAADGGLGALIAADLRAENLRVAERWLKVQTKPTGAPYPVNHPLVPEYVVNIGRLLAYDFSDLAGLQFTNQTYVLDVVWNDESGEGWHRATFYGVTISTRDNDARDVEAGQADNLEFNAQYVVPAGGLTAVPPPPSAPPLRVRYVSATENILLYTFAAGGGFTAQADTTARATIGNDFAITFANHAAPALFFNPGDGWLRTYAVEVGFAPGAKDLPRLDFFCGGVWLGSVTARGKLGCAQLRAVVTPETDAGFLFGNPVTAAWRTDGLQVTGLEEFFPTDLPGLVTWHRAESLRAGAPVTSWLDETGNHPLAASGQPQRGLVQGVPAVALAGGDYFHCADPFDTAAVHLFVVARRAAGAAGVPVAGFGATGDGSLSWRVGKQAAVWQDEGAIPVSGTLADGNAWSLYELEKGATGTNLRLNGQPDGTRAHGAFGSAQDYFLGNDGNGGPAFQGWVRTALVFDRVLAANEADQVRLWLRANFNLP